MTNGQEYASVYLPPKRGKFKEALVHLKHRVQFDFWRRAIKKYSHDTLIGATVVDIGSGPGNLLKCFRDWLPDGKLIGADIDQGLLDYAASRTEGVYFGPHLLYLGFYNGMEAGVAYQL